MFKFIYPCDINFMYGKDPNLNFKLTTRIYKDLAFVVNLVLGLMSLFQPVTHDVRALRLQLCL